MLSNRAHGSSRSALGRSRRGFGCSRTGLGRSRGIAARAPPCRVTLGAQRRPLAAVAEAAVRQLPLAAERVCKESGSE